MPKVRFLVMGPSEVEMRRIHERLPRSYDVELVLGENQPHIKLPANVDYALVSGHNDYTRRWQDCRATYGVERVVRLSNGSIGAFVNKIQELYAAQIAATTRLAKG